MSTPAYTGDDASLEAYARQAAALGGLELPDDWWPLVLPYLGLVLGQAAVVATAAAEIPGGLPEDPAGAFMP